MPGKKNKKMGRELGEAIAEAIGSERLTPETKKSIWAIVFFGLAIVLTLAAMEKAGPAGDYLYVLLRSLLGIGYFVLPGALAMAAIILLFSEKQRSADIALFGVGLVVFSVLGIIHILLDGQGGWLGFVLGSLQIPFGETAAVIINLVILVAAFIIAANTPIKITLGRKENVQEKTPTIIEPGEALVAGKKSGEEGKRKEDGVQEETLAEEPKQRNSEYSRQENKNLKVTNKLENYSPPPISLLKSASDKPTTGDLLSNANIIKRTLDSFGIPVEMGEINVGPAVTRYTLKPAEGVKLSRIEALHKDLSLSLAAHPIRIEAPIPGKSLVGIEVPNKTAALVRLGSLVNYPEFQKSGPLGFALGRDVSGEPIFADIEKMPHLLVAGATGSGKSILIHSLLVSLLYKNSPATLRMALIDPKRVELSIYEGIPHLISPVVTESKKAIGVFRWAIEEMEKRYDLLLKAGCRDIKGYNASGNEPLPYLLLVVDELADLMSSYGREVEGSIVRLAQMARATGLHLILSTQRPSVEVITGLIKANITSRIALQVASQVDSRTILDTSGAEKLLGHGDILYISSELSKPKRLQGSYITEEEINKVAGYVKEKNKNIQSSDEEINFEKNTPENDGVSFDDYLGDENDDEMLEEAMRVVTEAKKASASLLQRRLKVGYARAARLLDMMEERGAIGPGDGAKPREVYLEKTDNI